MPILVTCYADKGHDFTRYRRYLKQRDIMARIARCGVESHERPGRRPWVVEHTNAWFARFGKPRSRFERRLDKQPGTVAMPE